MAKIDVSVLRKKEIDLWKNVNCNIILLNACIAKYCFMLINCKVPKVIKALPSLMHPIENKDDVIQ